MTTVISVENPCPDGSTRSPALPLSFASGTTPALAGGARVVGGSARECCGSPCRRAEWMRRDNVTGFIPNPHESEIGVGFLTHLLRRFLRLPSSFLGLPSTPALFTAT